VEKEIEEIKEREKTLLEDVKKTEENRDDHYTTLRVKKAQLTWTYAETEKKMVQMCGLIAKARHEIEELDKVYPELKDVYYQKYMDARRQAGFTSEKATNDQSFMKYLVEDIKLPSVEAEYQRLFGEQSKE
jgi:predicted S18 family serine protease